MFLCFHSLLFVLVSLLYLLPLVCLAIYLFTLFYHFVVSSAIFFIKSMYILTFSIAQYIFLISTVAKGMLLIIFGFLFFGLWSYLMNVILELCRVHLITVSYSCQYLQIPSLHTTGNHVIFLISGLKWNKEHVQLTWTTESTYMSSFKILNDHICFQSDSNDMHVSIYYVL